MCIQFQELKSEDDWASACRVFNSLKPSLNQQQFLGNRKKLKSNGYILFGLKKNRKLITVVGAVLTPHIIDESNFWVVDMVTLPEHRSQGYGTKMLKFLENFAIKRGCKKIIVHSRIKRDRAHDFYKNKSGFNDYAYLFSKPL